MRGLLVLSALAAGCGFASRSQQYECDGSGECPDGRTCVSGWCVTEASAPDASYVPPVECESGSDCTVSCDGPGACSGGVDCSNAASCDITCSGDGSCAGPIECGDGPCTIDCSGEDSCGADIDCDGACSCDVTCIGNDSCGADVDCPRTGQCRDGDGCTSGGAAACDSC